ncbi:hypothetical protein Pma05_14030 [Plantactinospora mayteni]|uniref:Uncharacterized protein n=1 Tax=Plantactinospora mayteni TaxID=566021 RepID=A0ABQ4EJG4_9ACTN|nr:hypothetical protein Pma05_14030 [Plantactinospora mayteni]
MRIMRSGIGDGRWISAAGYLPGAASPNATGLTAKPPTSMAAAPIAASLARREPGIQGLLTSLTTGITFRVKVGTAADPQPVAKRIHPEVDDRGSAVDWPPGERAWPAG